MLLPKIKIFIFISILLSVEVSTLEEDGQGFFGEPEYLPEQQNWFRVNRKEGEDKQLRPQRDAVVDARVLESEEDEQGETFTRNRRLYTPPAIVREGGRPPVQQRRDGDQCQCDMEYVLKYKGVQPRGEYQVKVYHEETGKFTGEDPTHRHYHNYQDNHRGWNRGDYEYADRKEKALVPPAYRNKYEYYTEAPTSSQQRQQQQQQQQGRLLQRQNVQQEERPRYQYYVEEVVDDGGGRGGGTSGERRRGELFVRGNGPSKSRVIRRNKFPQALRKNRKLVKLARFIVSKAEWGMVAIISGRTSDFGGYPFSEYFRMSDGVSGNGSGIPYVYMRMAVLDACGDEGDIEISKASLTVSLNEGEGDGEDDCRGENSGGMVACASVTLSGRIIPVTSTKEIDFAENALMSKHRKLEKDGFFAKLVISQVVVFTNSGSGHAHRLEVDEYLDYS